MKPCIKKKGKKINLLKFSPHLSIYTYYKPTYNIAFIREHLKTNLTTHHIKKNRHYPLKCAIHPRLKEA